MILNIMCPTGRLALGRHVFGNKLSGAIPVEIANLTKLEVLGLDHNQLTGIIPSELGRMKSLRSL